MSVHLPSSDNLKYLRSVFALLLCDVLYEKTASRTLSYLQLLLLGLKKVEKLLVVDFKVLALHLDLVHETVLLSWSCSILLLLLESLYLVESLPDLDLAEKVLKTPGQETSLLRVDIRSSCSWALDGESFSRSCLTVSKDRTVVAL